MVKPYRWQQVIGVGSKFDVLLRFPNFDNMKPNSNQTRRQVSKGDRLRWTPLKEVSSVRLSSDLTKGKPLTSNDLTNIRKPNLGSKNFFVP